MIWIGSFMTSRRSTGGRASVWWPPSEGIHYADGRYVSEAEISATDGFGHVQLGGLAPVLAHIIKLHTGAKVRGIELSLLQRCSTHIASQTDIDEAYLAGKAAVEAAVAGNTGKMVAFRCTREGGYRCETTLEPLDIVANFEEKGSPRMDQRRRPRRGAALPRLRPPPHPGAGRLPAGELPPPLRPPEKGAGHAGRG